MDNQQERLAFDVGWLVGVWESEGWISLRKCFLPNKRFQRFRPEMGFTNTDPVVLDNVERIMKQLQLPYWRTRWQLVKGQRSRSMIKVDGVKRCQHFIQVLGDKFVSKKDRIAIVKEFIDYRLSMPGREPYGAREHEWFDRLRVLNAPISKQSQDPQRLYAEPAVAG